MQGMQFGGNRSIHKQPSLRQEVRDADEIMYYETGDYLGDPEWDDDPEWYPGWYDDEDWDDAVDVSPAIGSCYDDGYDDGYDYDDFYFELGLRT